MWKQKNPGCFTTAPIVKIGITPSRRGRAPRAAPKQLSPLDGIGVRSMNARSGFSAFVANIVIPLMKQPETASVSRRPTKQKSKMGEHRWSSPELV
jgi:hypothetical protein